MEPMFTIRCPSCGTSPKPCLHPEHLGEPGPGPDFCCSCYHDES